MLRVPRTISPRKKDSCRWSLRVFFSSPVCLSSYPPPGTSGVPEFGSFCVGMRKIKWKNCFSSPVVTDWFYPLQFELLSIKKFIRCGKPGGLLWKRGTVCYKSKTMGNCENKFYLQTCTSNNTITDITINMHKLLSVIKNSLQTRRESERVTSPTKRLAICKLKKITLTF